MSKDKISKEFKIGTLVLVVICLLIFGLNYLKGINLFHAPDSYYAVYENIDYLKESNPVFYNGRQIGLVKSTEVDTDNDGQILVEFLINIPEMNIPSNSIVTIKSSDLLGSKGMELTLGDSEEIAAPGDTLIAAVELDMAEAIRKELEPLKKKTDELIGGIDEVVTNLKAVFEDDATQDLPKAFESLQRSLENLEGITMKVDNVVEQNGDKLSMFFDNINSISTNLKDNNDALTGIIANFEAISDSLAKTDIKQTITKADNALAELDDIVGKINNGEGSISLLLNNDSLHNALVDSNKEIQYLINDIYENPWRYVHISIFGKKPDKKYSKKELEQLRDLVDEAIEESEEESK